MSRLRRNRVFLGDAVVALGLFLLLLALYPVTFLPVRPWYLLVFWFYAFRNPLAPGLATPLFEAAFALYLVVLAAGAARLAARLRRRYGSAGRLRYGVAGGLLTLALLGVANLVLVVTPAFRGDLSPLLVAAAMGLAGLWAGWRLAAAGPRPESG